MGYEDGEYNYTPQEIETAPMWSSGTVYYDDEIVQYQGRYYIALCKTSAQMPGRSKHGIWKELVYEDEEGSFDDANSIYDEEPTASIKEAVEKKAPVEKKAESPKKAPTPKKTPEPVPVRPENKREPVNKPIAKKQTLKERQDAQVKAKTVEKPIQRPSMQTSARKMTVAPSNQNIVNDALKEMNFKKIKGLNTDDDSINSSLILAQIGKDGMKLIWESSHPNVISSKGEVNRPDDGHDVAVNLSLTVSKGDASATRFFTLWVKALEKSYSDKECVSIIYDMLEFEQFQGKNVNQTAISDDLELITDGLHETKIYWASSQRDLLDETGQVYKNRLIKSTKIRLYAIVSKGEVEKLKYFDLTLKAN